MLVKMKKIEKGHEPFYNNSVNWKSSLCLTLYCCHKVRKKIAIEIQSITLLFRISFYIQTHSWMRLSSIHFCAQNNKHYSYYFVGFIHSFTFFFSIWMISFDSKISMMFQMLVYNRQEKKFNARNKFIYTYNALLLLVLF